VCEPWPSPEYETGEPHAVRAAPSRLHWKVEADWFDVNEKVAEVLATSPDGPAVMVTFGALTLAELDEKAGPAATAAAATTEIRKNALIEETIIPPQSVSAKYSSAAARH